MTSVAAPGRFRPARAAGPVRMVRDRAATTPGLLRVCSIALVGGLAVVWALAFTTALDRAAAVRASGDGYAPAFVAAQRIHAVLSEADAAAAGGYLAGGVEPPGQRATYDRGIADAATAVASLSRAGVRPTDVEGNAALTVLAGQLPVYTGLVDRARADNRSGDVVGAAYLRRASALMQQRILPAADTLAAEAAAGIDRSSRRATGIGRPLVLALAGLATLAGLVAVQLLLTRRTNRVLNVPLALATLITAAMLGWVAVAVLGVRSHLVAARDDGYVPTTLISQARSLGLRAWADGSQSLIARGDGAAFDTDADAATRRLGYDPAGKVIILNGLPSGALGAAVRAGAPDTLVPAWTAYQATSIRVRSLLAGAGGFPDAVSLAVGDGTGRLRTFDTLAARAQTATERRFTDRLGDARSDLTGLPAGLTAGAVIAALLALAGLQLRIDEYR